jgi:hypothetical protein
MTYNPNIPIGVNPPANQVVEIQTNFSKFASIFSTTTGSNTFNHTAFNTFNAGDHETILFELQTTAPGVTLDLDVLFSMTASSKLGSQPQLFLQIPKFLPTLLDTNNPGNPAMQLTYNSVNTAGPVYQSFLAGGYLLFFGSTSNIATNITLSPAPTAILIAIAYPNTVQSTGNSSPFTVSTTIISNNQFKINSNLGTTPYSFTWMAIGSV